MSSESGTANILHPSKNRRDSGQELRRLSSSTARPVDLYAGNVTVAPSPQLSKFSDAHETAIPLETAKTHLAEESGQSTPDTSTGVTTPEEGGLKTSGCPCFRLRYRRRAYSRRSHTGSYPGNESAEWRNEYNTKMSVYFRRSIDSAGRLTLARQTLYLCHKRWWQDRRRTMHSVVLPT